MDQKIKFDNFIETKSIFNHLFNIEKYVIKLKYVSINPSQLVDICFIVQGIGVRTPVIPLIYFKGEISSHWAT
jgi:hypothetical protein